jgi:DNA-binding transcriptional regulator YdaS (Cro superfamily)
MPNDGITNEAVAREAWGKAAPEWVVMLAERCDKTKGGQSAIARQLGVSGSMINQALKNTYAGRLDRLEQRVRGELMNETVRCPVLSDITKRRCIDEQSRTYAATNAVRIELRRACRSCPNRMGAKEEA